MDDVKKMFRTIVNGQSAVKSELLSEIKKLDGKVGGFDRKLSGRIDELGKEMKKGFKDVNERLDKIGKSVSYLEDDAPTIDEFDKLEGRVTKLETRVFKN